MAHARLADPGGGKDAPRSVHDIVAEDAEIVGAANGDIVHTVEAGVDYGGLGVAFHVRQRAPGGGLRCGLGQDAVQLTGRRQFSLRQIGVARRQGQTPAVPFGRCADDLDRQVQVPHEPANDHQLLIILLAENGEVGLNLIEQFGHDQSDAAEHLRSEITFQPQGGAGHGDAGGEAVGIHFSSRRGEHQVTPGAGQQARVFFLLARVFVQVFMGGELRRIDEVGDDDAIGATGGLTHQGQMAFVQGAHGGNHADAETLSFPVPNGRAQVGHGADYGQGRSVHHDEAINLSA